MTTALAEAKKQLRHLETKPVKGLGQHFLIDRSVLKTITSAAELTVDDIVVEVGPGLGVLTKELIDGSGKVLSIEVDKKLADTLRHTFSSCPNFTVVNADILDLDIADLISTHVSEIKRRHSYKVVANLPYYIASPILRRFLESPLKPSTIVVMVQKEVGQSMAGGPGDMSLLSVSIQLYGKPSIVEYIPPECFYPQPKVDSAIIRINVYPKPAIDVEDITGFFEVVKAGFSTPRKQLRNSLSIGLGIPTSEVNEILEQVKIAPQRRPQTLSLEEWAALYQVFTIRNKQ